MLFWPRAVPTCQKSGCHEPRWKQYGIISSDFPEDKIFVSLKIAVSPNCTSTGNWLFTS